MPENTTAVMVERARRAFGDALSIRVNMNIRLGDVPVQVLREAMAEALRAALQPTEDHQP
jgi:hypothetical protein